MLGERFEFRSMQNVVRTETFQTTNGAGAGDAAVEKEFHHGLVEQVVLILGILVDVDDHFLRWAQVYSVLFLVGRRIRIVSMSLLGCPDFFSGRIPWLTPWVITPFRKGGDSNDPPYADEL